MLARAESLRDLLLGLPARGYLPGLGLGCSLVLRPDRRGIGGGDEPFEECGHFAGVEPGAVLLGEHMAGLDPRSAPLFAVRVLSFAVLLRDVDGVVVERGRAVAAVRLGVRCLDLQPSCTSWAEAVREWVSRFALDHGWPHASPRCRLRKAIRCHIAYSGSSATKPLKAPVRWGVVQTTTGDGSSPVCSHLATCWSVHTSAFGLRTGSISTCAAGLNVMICCPIASFRAARRVALTCRRVAGPVMRRKGSSSWKAAVRGSYPSSPCDGRGSPLPGSVANSLILKRR